VLAESFAIKSHVGWLFIGKSVKTRPGGISRKRSQLIDNLSERCQGQLSFLHSAHSLLRSRETFLSKMSQQDAASKALKYGKASFGMVCESDAIDSAALDLPRQQPA
jgi:hypothetical protein